MLQESRAVLVGAEAALSRADAACAVCERQLESALSALRALADGGAAVAAHELQRTHEYARAQAGSLAVLQRARERDLQSVSRARDEVSVRLREVKTIERLRERRRASENKWELRRDQARLDELGIISGWTSEATWPSAESES